MGQPLRFCSSIFILLILSSCGKFTPQKLEAEVEMPQSFDTVVLKNGGMIQGKIVRENLQEIAVRWQDGVISFKPDEVRKVKRSDTLIRGEAGVVLPEKKEESAGSNGPHTYPRVYLKNGKVKMGVTIAKKENSLVVGEKVEGGGNIEFTFPLGEVEKMALWPPPRYEIKDEIKDIQK